MEDWLHCNACYIRIIHKPESFSVTNCAHIFCNKCVAKAAGSMCVVCNRKCSFTLLHVKMPANTAIYFKEPKELVTKAMEMLKLSEDVRKFQSLQRKSLMKALTSKNEQKEKLLQAAVATMTKTKKENSDLKKFIIKNRKNIPSISPSHPFMTMQFSPDCSPPSSPQRISSRKTPPHYYSSVPS
uniref:RING-type domain-containing protein n=1 Tax=Ciona savignyi TaxID=51511 RepID=H2YPW8_CIOSA